MALGVSLATGCSRPPAGEAADTGPRVYATGTITWGQDGAQKVDWNLQEIAGFSRALSLKTVAVDQVSTLSASRQSPDDRLWFVWANVASGAPTVVFGGATADVDRVVVVDTEGNQLTLPLSPAGQGWQYAVTELPAGWVGNQRLDVVGLSGTREVAREPLARVA